MRLVRFAKACSGKRFGGFFPCKRRYNLLTGPFTVFSTPMSQVVQRTTRKANILFFGTGDFAVPTLAGLYDRKDLGNIEVVTAARKGNSKKLEPKAETPVKDFCLQNNLKLHEIGCKSDLLTLARGELTFDVAVVVSFGFFLPHELLKVFPSGAINLHPSKLPSYRGAAPIEWAILNGEKEIGISLIAVDPAEFDTGDIYMQRTFNLGMHEVRGNVAKRLAHIGSSMVEDFFDRTCWSHKSPNILSYSGGKKVAQGQSAGIGRRKARKLLKSKDAMVAWDSLTSLGHLYNRWRALGENIGCWTICLPATNSRGHKSSKLTLKLIEVEPQIKLIGSNLQSDSSQKNEDSINQEIGSAEKLHGPFEMYFSKALSRLLIYNKALLDDDSLVCLPCVRVQMQGKNASPANTFANGYMKKQHRLYLATKTNHRRAYSTSA